MDDKAAQLCPHAEHVSALAHGDLDEDATRLTVRHLEQHEACRELYRVETAGAFPRIANYTIIRQIDKGGFGVVYQAIHHAKERVEALKVLFGKTPVLTSYFENEVHLIAKLRNPNIATLYEAQLATPPLYYTMEFVDGVRLDRYLKQGTVSLKERIEIIRTVALALAYAHEQGVVHRDIKPQNILIDADRVPHIVDFGIGKRLGFVEETSDNGDDGERKAEGAIGTVGYIAPEQIAGQEIDARADIFALGALLFYCVTGEPARLAGNASLRRSALERRQVGAVEDLSAIIGRCVEPDPAARYATCRDLADDLTRYVSGRPIQARATHSPLYRIMRIGALVLRTHPLAVRATILAGIAFFLTALLWTQGARVILTSTPADNTVIVGFMPSTVQAIREGRIGADLPGLDANVEKSWRMLHGALFEQLARARPVVVAWDFYTPDCQPQYDEYLLRGMRALKAPLIIGVDRFDRDGEPLMCADIRAVANGWAMLRNLNPDYAATEYEVLHYLQRGLGPAIPSLAVRAFAATRFPDCDVVLQIDRPEQWLELRYRRRGQAPGEPRWQSHVDQLPLHGTHTIDEQEGHFRDMRLGDRLAHARVAARSNEEWSKRIIPVEDVLTADLRQLREWFNGQAVVVGRMIPPWDHHETQRNEWIFGCQVHADALSALLSGAESYRYQRSWLAMRCVLWCALAGLLVSVQPRRRWHSLGTVAWVCVIVFGVSLTFGVCAVELFTDPWMLEAAIAISALFSAGSLALWAKAASERQYQFAPGSVTLDRDGSTLQTTLLAETR